MDDIYGMLIILGLVLVISQCANNERTLLESMTNDNKPNSNVNTNSPNGNTGLKPNKFNGNVFKYYPGETLNADANSPYGFKVPPSMQQEYTLLKDMGISNDSALAQKEVMSGYAKFLPTDSQYPGFDPSSKGGLLKEQQGKHVKTAQAVANYLPRNINGNSNSQVMAANSNEIMSNAGVASNRNVKKPDDSLINSNAIGLSNRNSKGVKGINLHLIYAPWCGHSKKALPDFDMLMSEFDGQMMNGYKLNIKKHNADEDKSVSKKFNVKGFPSYVMETVNGGVSESKPVNERSYDGLLNALKAAAV